MTNATFIAKQLNLDAKAVEHTLSLLRQGCTIPFICRYRKEMTGSLDEVQIAAIEDWSQKLAELEKRKETIVKTLKEQDQLTGELSERIANCWQSAELEDIYLPYKPKRRTKAQIAREQGLQPLANLLLKQQASDPLQAAEHYARNGIATAEDALSGALNIIAEQVSEDERSRLAVRKVFRREAILVSKVVKAKAGTPEAAKYADYFDWSEPLRRCPSHRMLAMRRGEADGILRLSLSADDENCICQVTRLFVRHPANACAQLVSKAVTDGYKRLLRPAIENACFTDGKVKADEEAIDIFKENLRQLLLSAPLGAKRVMGIDPGFRTGCKVVCLNEQGDLLYHDVIYPHPPVPKREQATAKLQSLARQFGTEAIAIGNGTASRETESFIHKVDFGQPVPVFIVSEDGASIYSASKVAREEFPDQDVTVRGAVSIARRLMDPLAELVKIDPKSIGIGQYQHDVDQGKLKKGLDQTVTSCVSTVGANLNTASRHLLTYVSGLGPTLAQNIVDYRHEHGAFKSRSQLKKVPRLGPMAYQQCAGFLRIPHGDNPLDNSGVHPESYSIVEAMASDLGCTVGELMSDRSLRQQIDISRYVTQTVGMPTLEDIMKELEKPGLDPRSQIERIEFSPSVHTIDQLEEGMELNGIVTNITNFGAFVDIGVHQDGLVHISQMSDRFITSPTQAVKLHQHLRVKVIGVDLQRKRISLSMKGMN